MKARNLIGITICILILSVPFTAGAEENVHSATLHATHTGADSPLYGLDLNFSFEKDLSLGLSHVQQKKFQKTSFYIDYQIPHSLLPQTRTYAQMGVGNLRQDTREGEDLVMLFGLKLVRPVTESLEAFTRLRIGAYSNRILPSYHSGLSYALTPRIGLNASYRGYGRDHHGLSVGTQFRF